MDFELLMALMVLWCSSTICLFTCAFMWLMNEGEAFHPHSVDIERRHDFYEVVKSNTRCQTDFAVKSVSEFIAARGSSSEKYMTVLIVIGAVSGFLGTVRWYAVGDASLLEASLSQIGFFSLLIIAVFEVDVSSESFLEEKVLITSWFLEFLGAEKHLKFSPHVHNPRTLEFIRQSKELVHLFPEDDGEIQLKPNFFKVQFSMHVLGATSYAALVTAAIILNEINEEKVAWITGVSFCAFSFLGYLTGSYMPVLGVFKGWVLLWNPFMNEPNFLEKLQRAVNDYAVQQSSSSSVVAPAALDRRGSTGMTLRSRKSTQNNTKPSGPISEEEISLNSTRILSRYYFIAQAHRNPKNYLRVLSHVYMTVELVALMTPMIAMGIQWLTALCNAAPLTALIYVFSTVGDCMLRGDTSCPELQHSCIVGSGS